MFLANNVLFGSLNEIIEFIHNVITDTRTYDDSLILDRNITMEECFYKVTINCGFGGYYPSEKDMRIVWDIIANLKQEDWNRLYYKNNLYDFIDNKSMTKALVYILKELKKPFMDPNEVPEEIKVELNEFLALVMEYVYYHHQIIDRLDRAEIMIRKIVALTDTDSAIISFDPWYRYALNKVIDEPMKIKTMRLKSPIRFVDQDEFGDPVEKLKIIDIEDDPKDYSFYTDEVIDIHRSMKILEIIPQDGLRFSIINIMAYCVYKIINDYMERYTKNTHSWSPDRKCLLIMKNEFLFKRILLTMVKKHYASIQEVQEGKYLGDWMDIKGLDINKSTLNETTRDQLQEVLYEDILKSDNIDQMKVLKDLAIIEKKIYNSLLQKEKKYYKPLSVKSMNSYDDPFRISGIKASYVWNRVRANDIPAINLEEKNNIDVVKLDVNLKNVTKIKESYPEVYEGLVELLKQKPFQKGITAIGVPRDCDNIPDWILEFIDYTTIINDNLSNFPLEAIGLYKVNGSNNYTNILRL